MLAVLLAAALYGDPVVAFTFADPRISESSGLASASAEGVVFTHTDSGDDARFFAVDGTGMTLTTYDLPDVQARDWEDMARGPDEQGRSSLWLGDIGDNDARRDNGILVHRVAEPVPDGRERVTTEPPTSFRLRYPDGPGDAEGLVVHPRTGRLYVVTKPLAGPAQVYAAPQPLDPDGPNLLERVGEVDVRATGTAGGPGIGGLAQLLVTAADISPDGTRFAVRTYTDVYEYALDGEDLGAALARGPVVSPLPPTRQGEGLAYSRDGRSLLTSSEGRAAPGHRLLGSAPPPPTAEPGQETATP
ncbi:MAG: hypothetical protein JWN08_1609, partial [Frankiales bacterium]|nr:hypothetical protein [Frankiales bacterium]